jgi:ABC-type phosphate/phosphonate transport system substrate-binding protein
MRRVASLGMYDSFWLAPANDALWRAIAAQLRRAGMTDVPAALDRDRPLNTTLRDPDVLLGHTCGYPLMTSLRGRVRVVATPCFDLSGCEGAWHRSLIVVAAGSAARSLEDLRGGVAAINGPDSNTGMNLLRAA